MAIVRSEFGLKLGRPDGTLTYDLRGATLKLAGYSIDRHVPRSRASRDVSGVHDMRIGLGRIDACRSHIRSSLADLSC